MILVFRRRKLDSLPMELENDNPPHHCDGKVGIRA